jgi:hypothetical protein
LGFPVNGYFFEILFQAAEASVDLILLNYYHHILCCRHQAAKMSRHLQLLLFFQYTPNTSHENITVFVKINSENIGSSQNSYICACKKKINLIKKHR